MIGFFVQLIVPLALMFYRFPRKKAFWLWLLPQLAVELTISIFFRTPDALTFFPEPVSVFLYYLLCYLFSFLLVLLPFKLNVFRTLFFWTGAMVVQNFGHHFYGLIMRLAGIPLANQYDDVTYLLVLTAVYIVLYALFYLLILRKLRVEDLQRIPRVSTLLLSMSFLTIMIVLGIYIRHFNSDILENGSVAMVYELYSSILAGMILFIQFGIFRNARLEEGNRELQMRLEAETRYYSMARENMERINMLSHDLKHRLMELQSSDSTRKQGELKDLEKQVDIYDAMVESGNEALDYLLTEKMRQCRERNIDFSLLVDGAAFSFIGTGDLCSLFGNALDNAIEEQERVEEGKRRIFLRAVKNRGMSHIHVENACHARPVFENGFPKSTKAGKGHGYGTKSMLFLTEKYGGNLTMVYRNGQFMVDIFIPRPAENAKNDTESATK